MKAKQRNNLRQIFAQPQWKRYNKFYGIPMHAGRKNARELDDEKKARKGMPLQ